MSVRFEQRLRAGELLFVSVLTCVLGLAGCGNRSGTANGTAASTNAATAPSTTATGSEAPAPSGTGGASGSAATPVKTVGGIPYDVYFDNPLEIAANNTQLGGPVGTSPDSANAVPAKETMGNGSPPSSGTPTPENPAANPSSGGANWLTAVSTDQLQVETKKIRNYLTAAYTNVGTYNGRYKEIQMQGAVLAAIASVVHDVGEGINWKANAPYVRDLSHQMTEAANAIGKPAFEKSQVSFERLAAIFGGSIPPGVEKPAETRPLSEVADRGGLMRRTQLAADYLGKNITNATVFAKEQEQIEQEAAILALLGRVFSQEGYSNADEAEYQKFARRFIDGADAVARAAKEKNFEAYQTGLNLVQKSCVECHADYRNGN